MPPSPWSSTPAAGLSPEPITMDQISAALDAGRADAVDPRRSLVDRPDWSQYDVDQPEPRASPLPATGPGARLLNPASLRPSPWSRMPAQVITDLEFVVTVDADSTVLTDTSILVVDGAISAIGPAAEPARRTPRRDAGRRASQTWPCPAWSTFTPTRYRPLRSLTMRLTRSIPRRDSSLSARGHRP